MSDLQKAALTLNGKDIHLSMPFAKVNKQKRTVSGFATLDNLDTQGDIVLAEASKKAFDNAKGNLREMHQPIAAGRVLDFKEDEFYDKQTQKFYRGIYVTAYISKGAESTWEKVLDGTLTGFSIGGEVTEASNEVLKGRDKPVKIVKGYNLTELSLVDNPANQLSNIDSIQKNLFHIEKSADGSVTDVTGMVAETQIESVFYCEDDLTIQSKNVDKATCPDCGQSMKNIGWFENVGDRVEKVKEILDQHLAIDEKGGVKMAKKEEEAKQEDESVATGHEEGDPTEVPIPAVPAEEEVEESKEVEKAANVDEVVTEDLDLSKLVEDFKEVVADSLSKISGESKEQVESLGKKLEDFAETFSTRISELDEQLSSYGNKLETTKNKVAGLNEALEKFNSADALKKSIDLDDKPVEIKNDKTAWNGAFSINNVL